MNWIRTKDRLPDHNRFVLVCHPDSNEPVWIASYDAATGDWIWPSGDVVAHEVVGWMEFPKAIRTGGDPVRMQSVESD